MNWQQPQDNFYEDIDQHEAPTEPMMPIFPPSSYSAPTVPGAEPTVEGYGIPMPTPHERPFPYQNVQQARSGGAGSPQTPVYPVLPSPPQHAKKGKRPAGGATPDYPVYPVRVTTPPAKTRPQRRPSSLPTVVGVFFVLVQLLLLVRFVLRLLNISGSILWVGLIYGTSGIFVLPFRLLFQSINVPIPNALEIYTLIAILVYGLFSRLLVRLLKALLR